MITAPPFRPTKAGAARARTTDPAPTPAAAVLDPVPAVEARGLTKTYGDIAAVRGVDLRVHAGEIFGFLGPNGAGKSTTIGMLCTLIEPTGGSATVAGHDVVRERAVTRRQIGLVFQESTLDSQLTVERNLRFHAQMYGVPRTAIGPRVDRVLGLVGLTDRRGSKVKTLSGGMQRRLEIARGLLHAPRVLFLDEPTVGLDPQTRRHLWTCIRDLRRTEGVTIFMTTHYLDEAEVCDRVAIMDHGRIAALGTPAELKAERGADRVRFTTPDTAAALAALEERFGLRGHALDDGAVVVLVPDGPSFLPGLACGLGVPVSSMEVSRPSLDDVFLAWTDRGGQPEDGSAPDARSGPRRPPGAARAAQAERSRRTR
ncbi:ATP-binding cassette domain-containing protein [Streptomyces sp. NPDC057939]|uniref:ABC transporter ATP-binding protein n=1 Tax=Streptomyces sp. NPDC057939 TaxID=3346284 RepID=UPI0036EEE089